MPVAEAPQHMQALARANEVRVEAARQRSALIGQPASVVIDALLNPTPEFGRCKLRLLFAYRGGNSGSIIPLLGKTKLSRVLWRLALDSSLGRRNWNSELRLDELTDRERSRLVEELIAVAPNGWGRAAA